MNLLVPTLPLHGLRKTGRRSGDGFLSGDPIDTVHAEAQAMWDLRRLLAWLRDDQAAPAIGVMGYSLGGYTTALLASLDDGLACAIAGIPVTDFARSYYRHLPPLYLNSARNFGLAEPELRDVLRVVSPLALEPKIPRERRWIFAGVADRLVTADQVRDLWRHWEQPRIAWYPGGHMSFRLHPNVPKLVLTALVDSGLSS
jgi:dienelactone hydrolase